MNEEVVPPGRFRSFIPGNEFEPLRYSAHHPKKTRPRRESRGPESVTCRRTQPLCQGDDSRAIGSLHLRHSPLSVAGGRAGRIDHAGHGSRRALHHRHEQLPHHVRRRQSATRRFQGAGEHFFHIQHGDHRHRSSKGLGFHPRGAPRARGVDGSRLANASFQTGRLPYELHA